MALISCKAYKGCLKYWYTWCSSRLQYVLHASCSQNSCCMWRRTGVTWCRFRRRLNEHWRKRSWTGDHAMWHAGTASVYHLSVGFYKSWKAVVGKEHRNNILQNWIRLCARTRLVLVTTVSIHSCRSFQSCFTMTLCLLCSDVWIPHQSSLHSDGANCGFSVCNRCPQHGDEWCGVCTGCSRAPISTQHSLSLGLCGFTGQEEMNIAYWFSGFPEGCIKLKNMPLAIWHCPPTSSGPRLWFLVIISCWCRYIALSIHDPCRECLGDLFNMYRLLLMSWACMAQYVHVLFYSVSSILCMLCLLYRKLYVNASIRLSPWI